MVLKGHKDLLETTVLTVKMEQMVLKDHKGQQGMMVQMDKTALPEQTVKMAQMVLKDHKDLLEMMVLTVKMAQTVLKDHKDLLEMMVLMVKMEQMVKMVQPH